MWSPQRLIKQSGLVCQEFFQIASNFFQFGPSVQIADKGKWIGTYRAIDHSEAKLIIGKGTVLTKWDIMSTGDIVGVRIDGGINRPRRGRD